MATANDGSSRTQVFASDTDSNQVVSRTREGTGSTNSFSPFDLMGANVASPQRITAFKLTNNKPAVVVVGGDGNLLTKYTDSNNRWQEWSEMDKPSGVSGFLDVTSAYDSNGVPQLYAIGSNHQPYTRRQLSANPYAGWDNWQLLVLPGNGEFNRISAVRRADGTAQIFLVSATRSIYTLTQNSATPNSTWSKPKQFTSNVEPAAIVESAANLTEDSQVQIFAIDAQGSLWTRTMRTRSSNDGWKDWEPWPMKLFAPNATQPPVLNDLVTLTAGQWQEPSSGDSVPVVFATDRQGNIYYTTHSRKQGWQNWRSFY
jgi:hypothetical protein